MLTEILLYIIIFLYGIVVGSFVNVLIYRIPLHENIATEHSHCMTCNTRLRWYDLVPLFSWIMLKGRCRYCKARISAQYPVIELINGCGYVLVFMFNGLNLSSILYVMAFSMLTAITVIDMRTYEIPVGLNIAIGVLGIINMAFDFSNLAYYAIGMVSVSSFLLILYLVTKGRGIGGGDIKLMAAAGLLLGWKHIILALIIGCILGSIIHIALMKICKKDRMLAFGPYLSAGIFIVMLFGDKILDWYVGTMF